MDISNVEDQEVIERIARHCPEAMIVYIQCINRCDDKGSVFFSEDEVSIDMSEDWDQFRRSIKKLALENLLEWHPFDDGISITLADFPVEEE